MNWDFVELRANTPVTITQEFTMNQATKNNCEFAFHLGGTECATSPLPYTITFDDIYVLDPNFPGYPAEEEEQTNEIRVNQEGIIQRQRRRLPLFHHQTLLLPGI